MFQMVAKSVSCDLIDPEMKAVANRADQVWWLLRRVDVAYNGQPEALLRAV